MREPIKGMIFMGSGDHSARQVRTVLKLVRRGFNLLSGVQQCFTGPDHDPDGAARGEREIEEIVRDVAMALTGKEIEFK